MKILPPLVGFPLAGTESKYRVQMKNKSKKPKPTKQNKPTQQENHPKSSLTIGVYQGVEALRDFKANTHSCPNFLRPQKSELPKGTLHATEKR